jgi:tetratricopeptide (TPR) repeat protein
MMDKQKVREEIVYLARRHPNIAMERSNALIAEFPNEVWAWSLRSHVHETRGDLENAISDIDQAISIRFDEPGSHCDKARYFIQKSDFMGAIYSFSNAIEIGEKLKFSYHESLCRFMRAFCYCKIGDFKAAEQDLRYLDDDTQGWIDQLRTKDGLLEACKNRRLD